jgi:hypothetical protein
MGVPIIGGGVGLGLGVVDVGVENGGGGVPSLPEGSIKLIGFAPTYIYKWLPNTGSGLKKMPTCGA